MKNTGIAIYLFLVSCFCHESYALAGNSFINSVNTHKIKDSKYTAFVENIYWPSDETIKNKQISKDLIHEELLRFKYLIKKIIKPVYLPVEKDIDLKVIAVKQLRDNSDYLLLKYEIKGIKIQIQDGKALYILISPRKNFNSKHIDLIQYIKSIAFLTLNIPKLDKSGKEPSIFVSKLDIGDSKCGTITYESDFQNDLIFWYSQIRWWSDGNKILFLIGKGLLNGKDYSKKAIHPENFEAPRKFKKDINLP